MNIEKDDFFTITHGFKLFPLFYRDDDTGEIVVTTENKRDRSYAGLVFKALEVCGDMVCAACVFQNCAKHHIGRTFSFYLGEIEVMTVTPAYVKALQQGVNNEQT